jgi:LL-diaminopimelate aminotransferase
MNHQKLFADRIGGEQFGKIQQTFKFTLIDNAKKALQKEKPDVKIIDLGVGEPEERASDNIIKRLYEESLIKENRIYPCNGTDDFKFAAKRYLKKLLDLDFDAQTEIVHCMGMKNALAQAPLAFINTGDDVITTSPGYPVLGTMSKWLGANVHSLKLTEQNKYLPDLNEIEDIAKNGKTKILLLNYPNNPTGAVATLDFYERVVALAHKYNFIIIQDAAYADHVYEGKYISPMQVSGGRDVTIEMYSLSKGYNMQGFRLGFVVSNPTLLKAFALVKDNTDNGQFIAIQKAGVEALDNSEQFRAKIKEKYCSRMQNISNIFREAGIKASPAPGTFYLYFPVPEEFHGNKFKTAQEFTNFLISNYGIITVPWDEAGPHLRCSMTFEIGNKDFKDENSVYQELKVRIIDKKKVC